MTVRHCLRNVRRCLVLVPTLVAISTLQGDEPASKEIVLKDCLVIKSVGQSGRSPIHVDAIEADIVTGHWKPPAAGDAVQSANGPKRTWEAATANNGALQHAALGGGYLYWNVTSEAERVMILEAGGHLLVYVNGEPRVGDPYQNGIVRVPVLLHKGSNDLLFLVGRGQLRAKLVQPASRALLNMSDVTLPDYILGETGQLSAAVVVINADTKPLEHTALDVSVAGADVLRNVLPTIPPLSTRKVAFKMPSQAAKMESKTVELKLWSAKGEDKEPIDSAKFTIGQLTAEELHKRTFISDIDGSVQYYAVQPAIPAKDTNAPLPALFLTLHGASVEAAGQAAAYGRKQSGHIVAPTNRRPYGFDWEDWGRLDALEVLAHAKQQLKTDPRRTYLTGHSMGGHGTWHVGVTFPDRFAAIAPSAGWISFATYAGGGKRPDNPTPMQAMLFRAALPSETLALERNYANYGVYVLHGEADDNVPVEQARAMRKELGTFHSDFVYYERPGAGHWWGNACVDWPPLFDFLLRHELPDPATMPNVDFTTASPGVSATCHWATIVRQTKAFEPSSVQLKYDPEKRLFSGKTQNVARLSLELTHLKPDMPLQIDIDGDKIAEIPWPAKTTHLWLIRESNKWVAGARVEPGLKTPLRSGPFKDAFRNRVVFVYGTKGTKEENAWAFAKARYDAETFWYRGNGSIDVVADIDFDAKNEPDRNVIIYGNADTHAAWKALLGDSPVQVKRGEVQVGDKKETGDDLATLFVRPRPGSNKASVGVISGTGLPGMRLTERMPYFVSGVAYPDCMILGPDALTKGVEGVRMAGFFGNDWSVTAGEFVWK
jgi:pimeloyl-ACP methyl ester carboxylesterase